MTIDREAKREFCEVRSAETKASSTPLRRRSFLGAAGTFAFGGATLGFKQAASAQSLEEVAARLPASRHDRSTYTRYRELRRLALVTRIRAANLTYDLPIAPHATTGDDTRYPLHLGADTRGLPHNQRGEVDEAAFAAVKKAWATGSFEDFENVPLGGTRKFVNPVGTLAPSLEGANVTQIPIPAAPAIESDERVAEAVEQYWQSVLRDVSFADLATHPDAQAAADELSTLPGYAGPKENGRVTPAVLFRGSVAYVDPSDRSGRKARHSVPPGVLDGPHVPQFLFRETPFGTQSLPALHRLPLPNQDFLYEYEEWLAVQNGVAPTRSIQFESTRRHLRTLRDLAEHTHGGSALFASAVLQLAAGAGGTPTAPAGIGAPVSPTNPYRSSKTQASAAATFGLGYLQALINVGVSRAIRAAYWSKFFVHRAIRPEAFGGLVYQYLENDATDYPVREEILNSQGLARALEKFGSPLIAHSYPEGAPIHSSYPAGSAATAGVSATLAKGYFDESYVIPNPVVPDPADPTKLVPYTGAPLTVGGELNKLASISTFGRVISGIHWRSDAAAGLVLGEEIAISILREERLTFQEPFQGFTFTRFDGSKITV